MTNATTGSERVVPGQQASASGRVPWPARLVPAPARPHRSGGGRPFDRLLPVLFVWILISAAAGSLDLVAALCIVFVFALAFRIGSGGRR